MKSEENFGPQDKQPVKKRRKSLIVATALVLGLTSAVGAAAFSETRTYAHLRLASQWHGDGQHGRASPAEMEKRVDRMVKHLAIEIDATQEQQERITALARSLVAELMPTREEFRDAGHQAARILTAPVVDRAELERVRMERMAEIETISKSVTSALADVAEILTTEQRQLVAERIEQFHSYHRRWHRG